jgi:hypothetical protein
MLTDLGLHHVAENESKVCKGIGGVCTRIDLVDRCRLVYLHADNNFFSRKRRWPMHRSGYERAYPVRFWLCHGFLGHELN